MTSIERAKRFLETRGRTIALTIVPLAALGAIAPSAKATLIFNPSAPTTCTATAGSCSVVSTASDGVSLSGTGTAPINGTIQFSASGSASGDPTEGQTIPLSWNFSVDTQSGSHYSFEIVINGAVEESASDVFIDGLTVVSGSTSQDLSSFVGAGLSSWMISVSATGEDDSSPTLTVQADSSIDIGGAPSAVPEPATFGLLGSALAGLGALAFWRRKKKLV